MGISTPRRSSPAVRNLFFVFVFVFCWFYLHTTLHTKKKEKTAFLAFEMLEFCPFHHLDYIPSPNQSSIV